MCKNLEDKIESQWSWNYCNEDWWDHDQFDTKEQAIADAKENYEVHNEDINIGQCYRIPLPTDVDADEIFENLDEQYIEDGCNGEDSLFESVTKEQQKELENELSNVLKKWYKKVGIKSNWYTVQNISIVHVN